MPATPARPPHHNRRLPLAYRPLGELRQNPRDPRIYAPADRRRVVDSVRRFGPPPLVVTADGVMLSGNIWLEASKAAGYDEAPVVVAEHLSPAEADAYMLASVRLVERGADLVRATPVVVVAEHGDDRRVEAAHHRRQLVQVHLAVADEVARHDDEVGLLRVDDVDGGELDPDGRHPTDVQVGQVRDTEVGNAPDVGHGPREVTQPNPPRREPMRAQKQRLV